VTRKDGSIYDADFSIAPVCDASGKLRLLVGSIRDITPLKEAERAKDQFVSNVSHELRTPITSLKLNLNLLMRDPSRQGVYIGRLQREIDRLNDLIEDLLRLSRLEQGSIQLDLKPLDLNRMIGQFVEDRAPLAENRGLAFTSEPDMNIALVEGDAGLLEQALSVLVTNAFNYTPAGGTVTIRTQQKEDDRRRWVGFSVSDTGPGISPHEQPRLFQRFFRGEAGRKSGAPGTGLGLAIAKEIVQRHKGRLELQSDGIQGNGTTFSVWLPVGEIQSI
jgi:signal transduction histidine kinase